MLSTALSLVMVDEAITDLDSVVRIFHRDTDRRFTIAEQWFLVRVYIVLVAKALSNRSGFRCRGQVPRCKSAIQSWHAELHFTSSFQPFCASHVIRRSHC